MDSYSFKFLCPRNLRGIFVCMTSVRNRTSIYMHRYRCIVYGQFVCFFFVLVVLFFPRLFSIILFTLWFNSFQSFNTISIKAINYSYNNNNEFGYINKLHKHFSRSHTYIQTNTMRITVEILLHMKEILYCCSCCCCCPCFIPCYLIMLNCNL